MPDPKQPPPATGDELRQLAVELSHHSSELRTDLALELRELRQDVLGVIRRQAEHGAEVARGEFRLTRAEQQHQAEATIDRLGALGAALESRLSAVVIIGHVAAVLLVIVAVAYLR